MTGQSLFAIFSSQHHHTLLLSSQFIIYGSYFFQSKINDGPIPVCSSQMMITSSSKRIHNAILYFKNAYVKGSSTQIIHQHFFVCLLFPSISKSCRRWLTDKLQNIQACFSSRCFRSISFKFTKIRGNCNHDIIYRVLPVLVFAFLISKVHQIFQNI